MERIALSVLLPPVVSDRTAVYRIFNRHDELLYVGMTDNPMRRFMEHRKDRADDWWPDAVDVQITWYETRAEASVEEQRVIREEMPAYNLREQTDLVRLSGTTSCEIEPESEPHVTWRYSRTGAEQTAQRAAEKRGAPPEANTQQRRAYAKRLRANGVPVRKIATDLNMSEGIIYAYLSGRR